MNSINFINFILQIKAKKDEDLTLTLKADKTAGAHFLMIEMALAWSPILLRILSWHCKISMLFSVIWNGEYVEFD